MRLWRFTYPETVVCGGVSVWLPDRKLAERARALVPGSTIEEVEDPPPEEQASFATKLRAEDTVMRLERWLAKLGKR